jgi:hypothetical protein
MRDIEVSRVVHAAPETLYDIVSDLPWRTVAGEHRGMWLDGATEATVGIVEAVAPGTTASPSAATELPIGNAAADDGVRPVQLRNRRSAIPRRGDGSGRAAPERPHRMTT